MCRIEKPLTAKRGWLQGFLRMLSPVLLLGTVAVSAQAQEIRLTDVYGKAAKGTEPSLSDGKRITYKDASGAQVSKALEDAFELEFLSARQSAKRPEIEVILINGNTLPGKVAGAADKSETLLLDASDFGKLALPFHDIARVQVTANLQGKELVLPPLAKGKDQEDILMLTNGDVDVGMLTAVGPDGFKINSSIFRKERSFPMKDVCGAFLARVKSPPQAAAALATVVTVSGAEVTGVLKELSRSQVAVTSVFGYELAFPADAVVGVSFSSPRCVFLSDLEPSVVAETPFIGAEVLYPYRRDRSVVTGKRLSINKRQFRKGLGVHSRCELSYRLDKKYKRFVATVGLDDEAAPVSEVVPSVAFKVVVDGKAKFDCGLCKWGDEAREVDVPVDGADTLQLLVDFGDNFDVLDRATWGNARLVK